MLHFMHKYMTALTIIHIGSLQPVYDIYYNQFMIYTDINYATQSWYLYNTERCTWYTGRRISNFERKNLKI
jgi:hypothetical protein